MEYTIKQFADLSGVSTRTLRYYDEIELLLPKRVNESGYRFYGKNEVNRLQEILLYRKMGMNLNSIKTVMDDPYFDRKKVLEQQLDFLLSEKKKLNRYMETVKNSLSEMRGDIKMTDGDKFEVFKKEKLIENEHLYKDELEKKYPKETLETAKKRWSNLTKKQFEEIEQAEKNVILGLNDLLDNQEIDFDSQTAKNVFDNHKKFLYITAPFYHPEFHKSLGKMYVEDERFSAYYNNKTKKDSVVLLNEIIDYYTN